MRNRERPVNSTSPFREQGERRLKPRVEGYFPARVRGFDKRGELFETNTVLGNLSAGGLFLRTSQPVMLDSPLFTLLTLAEMKVAARGFVCRVESLPDGSFGIGVKFKNYRLLY
jgi:hypothetical protein